MTESETGGEIWDIAEMTRIHHELLELYNEKHGTNVRPALIKPIITGRVNSKYVSEEGVIGEPKLIEYHKKGLGLPELRRIVKDISPDDVQDKIYINLNKTRAKRFGYLIKETGKHIKNYRYPTKPKILDYIIITELHDIAEYTDLKYDISMSYILPDFDIDLMIGDSRYPIAGHLVDNVYIKFSNKVELYEPVVKETPYGIIAYVHPDAKNLTFEESTKLFE